MDGAKLECKVSLVDSATANVSGPINYSGTNQINMGQNTNETRFADLNYFDEVMVFDKALSASEIDTLHQTGDLILSFVLSILLAEIN